MWLDDKHWLQAARFLMTTGTSFRPIFAPAEFQNLTHGCLPLAFAHLFPDTRGLALIPKDDVDQLPLHWIRSAGQLKTLYADEVFVAMTGRDDVPAPGQPGEIERHLPYLIDRAAQIAAGETVRRSVIDEGLSTRRGSEPYALIAAASLTGNAGDRLITAACVRLLRDAWPDLACIVTNGDVDRRLAADAAAVIIGPGGMLYDIGEVGTRVDLQNLANYFKLGCLAEEYGRPLFALGIGYQTIATQVGWRFVKKSLATARMISTRDAETAALIAPHVSCPVQTLPDLSILFADEIAEVASTPPNSVQPTLVLCGDFRFDDDFPAMVGEIVAARPGIRVRVVVQANEDAVSLSRHQAAIRALCGDALTIEDRRTDSVERFIQSVATADAVITTRFHGMMVALMSGIDMVVFTARGDKRVRVAQTVGALPWLTLIDSSADRLSRARPALLHLVRQGRRDPSRAVRFDSQGLKLLRQGLVALRQ